MVGFAQDLKGPAELLGAKGRMQGEKDLDDFDWAIRGFCDRTHSVVIAIEHYNLYVAFWQPSGFGF